MGLACRLARKDQTEIELLITIKDDVAFEDDEEFYIDLFEPQVEEPILSPRRDNSKGNIIAVSYLV